MIMIIIIISSSSSICAARKAALSEALVATLKLPLPSQEARSREASLQPETYEH